MYVCNYLYNLCAVIYTCTIQRLRGKYDYQKHFLVWFKSVCIFRSNSQFRGLIQDTHFYPVCENIFCKELKKKKVVIQYNWSVSSTAEHSLRFLSATDKKRNLMWFSSAEVNLTQGTASIQRSFVTNHSCKNGNSSCGYLLFKMLLYSQPAHSPLISLNRAFLLFTGC